MLKEMCPTSLVVFLLQRAHIHDHSHLNIMPWQFIGHDNITQSVIQVPLNSAIGQSDIGINAQTRYSKSSPNK